MFRVITIWDPLCSEETREEFRTLAAEWAAQDRTNGQFLSDPIRPPATGPYKTTREFVTQADAEEWLNTVILPRATPASYQIIES